MAMLNQGFWNWNAQVTSAPLDLRAMMIAASPRNHAKMPAAKASPWERIAVRESPDCLMKPKIFSEITGRTHGIRFRINPPRKP